jgi:hypothetical protein
MATVVTVIIVSLVVGVVAGRLLFLATIKKRNGGKK